MPRASKKRRFKGLNRWIVRENSKASEGIDGQGGSLDVSSHSDDGIPSAISASEALTASEKKVGSTSQIRPEAYYTAPSEAKTYRLVELSSLMKTFEQFHKCEGGKIVFNEDQARRYGNSSLLHIECTKCKKKVYLQTSANNCESWNASAAVDVNRRMVYSAFEIGVGREAIATLCEIFNMPPPCTKNSWDQHADVLYKAHKEAIASRMESAKKRVEEYHRVNMPEAEQQQDYINIAVSYDGTWSKRGYTANFGIGFIISVDTGEVIDYDFESKVCLACMKRKEKCSEAEFATWFEGHKDECTKTHSGSSGSMECTIAKKIWNRSCTQKLRYNRMVCDGDSKAYNSIWDTYGCCDLCAKWENANKRSKEYKKWIESSAHKKWREGHDSGETMCSRVMKLDCIGHVQKRMGSHLRELRKKYSGTKLADGKAISGSKHRLTDKTIDKLQTYYGNAIRGSVSPGNLSAEDQKKKIAEMQVAIMAVLYHTCDIKTEKRHQFCPDGENSWCSYKREKRSAIKDHHLDAVFVDVLEPEFKRLSDYSLLLRCLPGFSQNANESINGLVWNRCPKHKFRWPHTVEMAAMSAVLHFNDGASARHEVMERAEIPSGEMTAEGSLKKDRVRITKSKRKAKEKQKKRRMKIRQAKLQQRLEEKESGPSYGAGMFNEANPLQQLCESDSSDDEPLLTVQNKLRKSDSSDDEPLLTVQNKLRK